MKERLVIKNFGPIEEVDLELGKMTILIGENATGKSTIAKVLAVCKTIGYALHLYQINSEKRNDEFAWLLQKYSIDEFVKSDTLIEYSNNDYVVKFDGSQKTLQLIPISEKFKEIIEYINESNKQDKIKKPYLVSWNADLRYVTDTISTSGVVYIPTERVLQSIFSLGRDSIQNMSDYVYEIFSSFYYISESFNNQEIEIDPLSITYKNEKGKGYFKEKSNEDFHLLSKAASGYQAIVPIVLAIKYYSKKNNDKNIIQHFIIEEPEISLFPKAQKELIEYFVENINTCENHFVLPTHSPYILSVINDLLIAFKRGQKFEDKVTNLGYKKEVWLNPKDVSVYQLIDGKAKSIINEELGSIKSNIIDDFSDTLNDNFDNLLDIE